MKEMKSSKSLSVPERLKNILKRHVSFGKGRINRVEEEPAPLSQESPKPGGIYSETKAILNRSESHLSGSYLAARHLRENARSLFWYYLGDMPMGHDHYSAVFLTHDGDLVEVVTDSTPTDLTSIEHLFYVPFDRLPELIAVSGNKDAVRFMALSKKNYRDYLQSLSDGDRVDQQ